MIRSISKLLCALTVIIASAGLARAQIVQTQTFTADYLGNSLLNFVSSQGNSLTFAYAPGYTIQSGDFWIDKEFFDLKALPHYALTGYMDFSMTATYDGALDQQPLGGDYVSLIPHCPDTCGPYDADMLAGSNLGTLTANGSAIKYELGSLPASGAYDQLFLTSAVLASNQSDGLLTLQTITITVGTVQISPVPEMPPAAMLGLGLAALAVRIRCKSGKKPGFQVA